MTVKRDVLEKSAPWRRPESDVADVAALQALQRGSASSDQQKRALEWIINHAAGTYGWSYRPGPDGERDTLIALGRQYVGQQIIVLLNSKIGVIAERQRILDEAQRGGVK